MISMNESRWEVWGARVKFRETPARKCRPIVILNGSMPAEPCSFLYVTSKRKDPLRWYDIIDYKEAGLQVPSMAEVHGRFISDEFLENC